MTNLTINNKNNTIEMSKKFAKAASSYGSPEYKDLQAARADYPTYKVVTKAAPKKKDSFKGLNYEYMENYIKTHNNAEEIMNKYNALRAATENQDDEFAEAVSYGTIKKWFLAQYPALTSYRENIKNILAA